MYYHHSDMVYNSIFCFWRNTSFLGYISVHYHLNWLYSLWREIHFMKYTLCIQFMFPPLRAYSTSDLWSVSIYPICTFDHTVYLSTTVSVYDSLSNSSTNLWNQLQTGMGGCVIEVTGGFPSKQRSFKHSNPTESSRIPPLSHGSFTVSFNKLFNQHTTRWHQAQETQRQFKVQRSLTRPLLPHTAQDHRPLWVKRGWLSLQWPGFRVVDLNPHVEL